MQILKNSSYDYDPILAIRLQASHGFCMNTAAFML